MITLFKTWLLKLLLPITVFTHSNLFIEWQLKNALRKKDIAQAYQAVQKAAHLTIEQYAQAFKIPITLGGNLLTNPELSATDFALYSIVVHRHYIPSDELAKIAQRLDKTYTARSNAQKIAEALSKEEKEKFLGINYSDMYTEEEINKLFIQKLHHH